MVSHKVGTLPVSLQGIQERVLKITVITITMTSIFWTPHARLSLSPFHASFHQILILTDISSILHMRKLRPRLV